MARVADTTRSSREETLSRDVDALHRQINTLAKRLSEAQARCRKAEEKGEHYMHTMAKALDHLFKTDPKLASEHPHLSEAISELKFCIQEEYEAPVCAFQDLLYDEDDSRGDTNA
jgi:predicted  nucleic acid-binding Zn-ribbon protein